MRVPGFSFSLAIGQPEVHELGEHVHDDDGGVAEVLDVEGVAVADLDERADSFLVLLGLVHRFADADRG